MIGYATIGTNDIEKARAFYDDLLSSIGLGRLMVMDSGFTMYGASFGQPALVVPPPYNGEAAVAGNGNMIAMPVKERAQVDALHARALELGGACEGQPGLRGPDGPQAFYGAYFRDLDGNKLCAFRVGAA